MSHPRFDEQKQAGQSTARVSAQLTHQLSLPIQILPSPSNQSAAPQRGQSEDSEEKNFAPLFATLFDSSVAHRNLTQAGCPEYSCIAMPASQYRIFNHLRTFSMAPNDDTLLILDLPIESKDVFERIARAFFALTSSASGEPIPTCLDIDYLADGSNKTPKKITLSVKNTLFENVSAPGKPMYDKSQKLGERVLDVFKKELSDLGLTLKSRDKKHFKLTKTLSYLNICTNATLEKDAYFTSQYRGCIVYARKEIKDIATNPELGFKFHLSVNPLQLDQAWEIVRDITSRYDLPIFKVVNLYQTLKNIPSNFTGSITPDILANGSYQCGGREFTLYTRTSLETGTLNLYDYRAMLQDIEQAFIENNIEPNPVTTKSTKMLTPYIGIRVDTLSEQNDNRFYVASDINLTYDTCRFFWLDENTDDDNEREYKAEKFPLYSIVVQPYIDSRNFFSYHLHYKGTSTTGLSIFDSGIDCGSLRQDSAEEKIESVGGFNLSRGKGVRKIDVAKHAELIEEIKEICGYEHPVPVVAKLLAFPWGENKPSVKHKY